MRASRKDQDQRRMARHLHYVDPHDLRASGLRQTRPVEPSRVGGWVVQAIMVVVKVTSIAPPSDPELLCGVEWLYLP